MKELKFKISSGLKNIIGKELITNDLIAIFELVKNSYDANAKKVRIIFKNVTSPHNKVKPCIIIIDDGFGMNYKDIAEKFLFVGYSEKKIDKIGGTFRDKIQNHRVFAGAKGVGRFSCDRLGSKLNLITKTNKEKKYNNLFIDWKKFEEDQNKEFEVVKAQYRDSNKVDIRSITPNNFKHGTILEISDLNGRWGKEELIKLKRYLQRLINPAQMGIESNFKISLEAKDFLALDKENKKKGDVASIINGPIQNFLFEKLKIKTTEINSEISENGKEIYSEVKDKGTFIFSLKSKNPYDKLKGIKIKIFYLNPNAKTAFKRIMGLDAVRYGSIFLYKNGIRIHPYGDEGDDWLEIEKRQTQGTRRYLSARNLMGRIEIYGRQEEIKEVSNREGGIIKNDSYLQLVDYIWQKVIRPLERFVVEGLSWDNPDKPKAEEDIKKDSLELIRKLTGQSKGDDVEISYNKNFLEILEKKEVEKAPEIVKNIEIINEYVKDKKIKDYVESQIKSLRSVIKFTEKERKEKEKEIEVKTKEILFLTKSMSPETEKISNLNHSIKDYALSIEERIVDIKNLLESKKVESQEILELLGSINILNGKIKTLAEMISQANFDTTEDKLNTDLVEYIRQYLKNIGTHKLSIKFEGEDVNFVTKFKPLEIGLIIDNFRSNSQKARANNMHIKFLKQDKKLIIYLADNGKGIDSTHSKFLFKRGESTTGGSGLGLYNIRRMLEDNNGTIEFIGNNYEHLGKGACFRIIING